MSLLNPKATASVLEDVRAERGSQDNRWGQQNHTPARWCAILAEEFGEAAREANELEFRSGDPEQLRRELIQVAAVAVAWVEAIDRAKESGRCAAFAAHSSKATPSSS